MKEKNFISEADIRWKASRSSGPGGQRVNKRSTKVQGRIAISALPLSDIQKSLVRIKLASRINKKGELEIECEDERSQEANKERALQNVNVLLAEALRIPKKRIPTKIPKGYEEQFREKKKKEAEKKQLRKFLPREWLEEKG